MTPEERAAELLQDLNLPCSHSELEKVIAAAIRVAEDAKLEEAAATLEDRAQEGKTVISAARHLEEAATVIRALKHKG